MQQPKKARQKSGSATAKGFRKPKISTTLESAKVFRLYIRATTHELQGSEADAFISSAGDAGKEAWK